MVLGYNFLRVAWVLSGTTAPGGNRPRLSRLSHNWPC